MSPRSRVAHADTSPRDHARLALAPLSAIDLRRWIAAAVVADVLGAVLLSLLIFHAYAEPLNYSQTQLWTGLAGFLIAWALASHSQDLYRRQIVFGSRRRQFGRAFASCLLTFGLILLLAFGFKLIGGVSRLWLGTWAASATAWILLFRLAFSDRLARAMQSGLCVDRALVFCGTLSTGTRLAQRLVVESRGQIKIAGVALLPGLPGAPSQAELEEAVRAGLIDWVFIGAYDSLLPEVNLLLSRLAHYSVDVSLLPNFQNLNAPLLRIGNIGMLPRVDVAARPLSAAQAGIKRAEDVTLALVGLLIMLPVMVLIAIAIKIDSPGPVWFRQVRAGFHGKTFRVWKFRTMRHLPEPAGELRQTGRNDDRVTAVGRILRRTSLDEIPQLINVLRGEMSIVGPRPHAVTMTTAGVPLHELLHDYGARHRIKPGITGWAQVNGSRGQVETEDALRRRVALDCHYIENWSLSLDAWIILRTLGLIATDTNAY